ncbi:MAG TPA: tetratricopeptide repeat protein [Flavobacterium sp.]|jgi:tetratricopeptide (TPR) repeat protein
MKKIAFSILFLLLSLGNISAFTQQEPDDIALESDAFQEAFYESLKQKGIDNNDKAITALEKCLQIEPNNSTVYFELGKNYLAMKKYHQAYEAFEKASTLDPKNKWALVGMYDVLYEQRDFNRAIPVVQKLVPFKDDYKEDLVSLYMNTQQFDKALELINELNETVGNSDVRDNYKASILRDVKYQGSEKENLLQQIAKNPKEEANYLSLIYLYSDSNQEEKALEIAKKLETEIPGSEWAQVSLFKFHLNNNDAVKAIKSMNTVLASKKIDDKIRHRVLNEFLIFAKDKPQYEADLQKAISYFDGDRDVQVAKEIGKFYHNKKNWEQAAKLYEQHLASSPDDMEAQFLLYNVYTESLQFEKLAKNAEKMIESFPLQPQFYYYAGMAHNQLKNHKKAKDLLETGLDYVVDDLAMEINFNIQLGEAYNGLGDVAKKESYFLKAEKLLKQKK